MMIPLLIGLSALFFVAFIAIAAAYRRVVPTNMVHIVQSKKTTSAFGRGKESGNVYYAWPAWLPLIGVTVIELPESIFQVSLADYEAYDQARLPFVVDVTAFFRIETAELAAQRVANFDELHQGLQAVLQGAVRRILATNALETILQSRSDLGDQFTQEVQTQIAEWGVVPVKTIEFMDLRDSAKGTVIANIMAKEQSRIQMESRVTVAENERTAELAVINAHREVQVQQQDAEQQVGLRTAEKDKAVGIANEVSRQEVLVATKLTTERQMEVSQVEQVKKAEIERSVAEIAAKQVKQVQVTEAEGAKEAAIIKAEADLTAALKDAEGVKAQGEARAAAEKAMLLAPVEAQLRLAEQIGENANYQQYLVTIEQLRANEAVGVAMAKSLEKADLKVIANGGDVATGMAGLGGLLGPKGGTQIAGMLSAMSQTDEGKALVGRLTGAAAAAMATTSATSPTALPAPAAPATPAAPTSGD